MKIAAGHRQDFEALPRALRRLLQAELAAGNEIVEVGHSFPAPPAGAYFKLARPVTTRARKSGRGIEFVDRNMPGHAGEFSDPERFHFILEPPAPPPPEPDMNAVRAALEAKQRAADGALYDAQRRAAKKRRLRRTHAAEKKTGEALPPAAAPDPAPPAAPGLGDAGTVERFRRSMVVDFDKWHDGVGYDVDLLEIATPEERAEIESLLLRRGVSDWRDVEALAALDSPRARVLLRATLTAGDSALAVAVVCHAPHLVDDHERAAILVAALEGGEFYAGLTQALDEVEEFHPPAVVEALVRGALTRPGEIAAHFAGMLLYVHGNAATAFDWDQRPFLLRFNTADPVERRVALQELCARIGLPPPAGK
jgi:hypothetical protein